MVDSRSTLILFTVRESSRYQKWLESLRDQRARTRILAQSRKLAIGLFGNAKSVGEGVSELKIDYGPGYRVYFAQEGSSLILLLCGGDKDRQQDDIALAKRMKRDWKEGLWN